MIWCTYISHYDYHHSVIIISLNSFSSLYLSALLMSKNTNARYPRSLRSFYLLSGYFPSVVQTEYFILSSTPLFLSFVLSFLLLSPFVVFIVFCNLKFSVWFFYVSFVSLLIFSVSSFVSSMFITAHWSIFRISSLVFYSDNPNIYFTLVLVEVKYFFSFKLMFSWGLECMSIFLIEIWTFWVSVMKVCIFFKSFAVVGIFWPYSGRRRWEHSSLLPCGSESPSSPLGLLCHCLCRRR